MFNTWIDKSCQTRRFSNRAHFYPHWKPQHFNDDTRKRYRSGLSDRFQIKQQKATSPCEPSKVTKLNTKYGFCGCYAHCCKNIASTAGTKTTNVLTVLPTWSKLGTCCSILKQCTSVSQDSEKDGLIPLYSFYVAYPHEYVWRFCVFCILAVIVLLNAAYRERSLRNPFTSDEYIVWWRSLRGTISSKGR